MTSGQGTSSHRGLSGGELVERAEACGLTPMLYGRPATESGSNIRSVPILGLLRTHYRLQLLYISAFPFSIVPSVFLNEGISVFDKAFCFSEQRISVLDTAFCFSVRTHFRLQ